MDFQPLVLPQLMPVKGIGAGEAARMMAKSQGIDLEDPYGVNELSDDVMKSLRAQNIEFDPAIVKAMVAQAKSAQGGLVTKATDPVILPQPYVTPTDFSAQYPQPLDPTEILTLCEEISTWRALM